MHNRLEFNRYVDYLNHVGRVGDNGVYFRHLNQDQFLRLCLKIEEDIRRENEERKDAFY